MTKIAALIKKNRLPLVIGLGILIVLFLVIFSVNHIIQVKKQSLANSVQINETVYAPILAYHSVNHIPTGAYTISPRDFTKQMQWLKDNGYTVIPLDQLYHRLIGKTQIPNKSIVITFDDGDLDNYTVAFPILKQFGYPATFFVISSFVGKPDYMTWLQLQEMTADGMTIGSHTVNHVNLAKIDPKLVKNELTKSKSTIEKNLSKPVEFFSYPDGGVNSNIAYQVQQAGYLAGVTTYARSWQIIKNNTDLLVLSRVEVQGTLKTFIQRVSPDNKRTRSVSQ
jgi:peptidoglycan/xylan/chitin deacetylase (PgdA/CDA1 family)